ncbi:MAG TPA: hypothetical protein PLK40_08155 [Bacteroidaceae bacterium]|nr:hypothetical protein [Bacteroidaceae bacterium]
MSDNLHSTDTGHHEVTKLKVNILKGAALTLCFWLACVMGLVITCAFVRTNLTDTVIVAILVMTLLLVIGGGALILKELFHHNSK